jgi:surface protein
MKKYLLAMVCVLGSLWSNAQDFITVWDLSYPGSSPTEIEFGVAASGNVNYTWETIPSGSTGSGSFNGITGNAYITGLPSNSVIRLKINPTNFNRVMFNTTDNQRLFDVEQWGSTNWISMNSAFHNCEILNISATDIPNLTSVSDMSYMFDGCSLLNSPQNIDTWNTSNVTDMNHLFSVCKLFNQPISSWNTGNVIDMSYMFYFAWDFNQPIGNWNTGNVTNMSNLFSACKLFNQPIGNWNTINVVNMINMFGNADSFNQPIGNWNTSNVTNMSSMFAFATEFNQDIGNWTFGNHILMDGMFNEASSFNQSIGKWLLYSGYYMLDKCGMDCINYSATLNGWANNPNCPEYRALGASNMYYGTDAGNTRNYLVNTKHWVITGDQWSFMNNCFPTSINSTLSNSLSISVSPNPTTSNLTISTSENFNHATIKVLNVTGQIILQKANVVGKQVDIDLSKYSNGIYFVEVNNETKIDRMKISKQ